MGLEKQEQKTYLTISRGKLRKKCSPETPGAVEWVDKDKNKHYELVYNRLTGVLEDVRFKDDAKFGKQWSFIVRDGQDLFAVQMVEGSRAGLDLLKKLPNLTQGETYRFTPWQSEENGKVKGGLAIVRVADDEKIGSYYQEFTEEGSGNWKVTNLHGFPEPEGDIKKYDTDDWKIYFTKLAKFLRLNAFEYLKGGFKSGDILLGAPQSGNSPVETKNAPVDSTQPDGIPEDVPIPSDDDLPF